MRFPYEHGRGQEKHIKRENATLTHVHVAEHWVGLKVHSLWVEKAPEEGRLKAKERLCNAPLGQRIFHNCICPGRYMLCK